MADRDEPKNELEGYHLLHNQESWGDKGSFGLRIYIKDGMRTMEMAQKARAAQNKREGEAGNWTAKSLFDTHEDFVIGMRAAETLKQGILGNTARWSPSFETNIRNARRRYVEIFATAGILPVYMQAIPNGYCSEYCCLDSPWFKATTWFGHVTIGWRKSVINIDWEESDVRPSGRELFPDEDVTKGRAGDGANNRARFIHAHGATKAAQYLARLQAEAVRQQEREP